MRESQGYRNRKGRNQSHLISGWYDSTHKRPQRLHKEIFRSDKQFQRSVIIQNYHIKCVTFLYTKCWNINQKNSLIYSCISKTKKELYKENFKIQRKKLKKILKNGMICHPHELEKIIVIMVILPKEIYKFKAISIKIQCHLLLRWQKILTHHLRALRWPQIDKAILGKKDSTRGFTIPDLRLHDG